ncbi:putative RNA helicase [Helianthus annuus]|nr:putative RNA helicase [Helianthus annuus]KAJ0619210.1 putative RNA helicase [Helianthus annuus]KAJ0777662.1 putative RNA helicase [Helianthus annuus]KAJ0786687.1 putative RNA helicase [Helianthus annuus]
MNQPQSSRQIRLDQRFPLFKSSKEVEEVKSKRVKVKPKAVAVENPIEIESAPFSAKSFSELGLPPLLIEALEREGFNVPTDIQSAAIPTIVGPLKGSGSPVDNKESGKKTDIEAVIIAPSRELGMQIVREIEKLLGPENKKFVQQLVGGANRSRQEEALRKNKPVIVVGTPGRIAEISAAGKLHTHGCRYLPGVGVVNPCSCKPKESVSRPPGPVNLSPGPNPGSDLQQSDGVSESLPPSLKHYYCLSRMQHKVDTVSAKTVIVFMNHTRQLKDAVYKLQARGLVAEELHGDLGKLARSTILKKFKKGDIRVLVTNELSARGLDVSNCDLVVNVDLPTDSVHYAHRAGRTGRLGRKGSVVTICEDSEVFVVKKLATWGSVSVL